MDDFFGDQYFYGAYMKHIVNIVVAILVVLGLVLYYAQIINDKRNIRSAARYAAERAWQDPIVNNCKNAVRGMFDAQTLMFGNQNKNVIPDVAPNELFTKTENGYLYYVNASDATTGNVNIACYTNSNGKVVRIVPPARAGY